MADKPAPKPNAAGGQRVIANDGAIPRMGMNRPMPASTKPPPAPTTSKSAN